MPNEDEPDWLARLRAAAQQRPRTQFQKVRWSDLQQLLRERDYLLHHADGEAKRYVAILEEEQYGRGRG